MRGRPAAGSVLRIGAAAVAFGAVMYALVPFTVSAQTLGDRTLAPFSGTGAVDSDGSLHVSETVLPVVPQGSCGPALIDAWHAPSPPSGWFGYAPLTSVPTIAGSRCRPESQRRLGHVGEALLVALALLFAAAWISRRAGWASGPTTSPAT